MRLNKLDGDEKVEDSRYANRSKEADKDGLLNLFNLANPLVHCEYPGKSPQEKNADTQSHKTLNGNDSRGVKVAPGDDEQRKRDGKHEKTLTINVVALLGKVKHLFANPAHHSAIYHAENDGVAPCHTEPETHGIAGSP
ncbi:hypothetical protein HG531_004910 [Fusarium graminearum]|nr:hypothetical protein HG531_004910 [Fusarium graminearum]